MLANENESRKAKMKDNFKTNTYNHFNKKNAKELDIFCRNVWSNVNENNYFKSLSGFKSSKIQINID